MKTLDQTNHRGPHTGMLALIFAILFNVGLSYVISFTAGAPHFPSPWESAETILAYFQNHAHDVMMCAFFQFASAIPLGILTVTLLSRFRFLGIRAAGPDIGLFGGLMTTFNLALSGLTLWAMAFRGVAQDGGVLRALYYLDFAVGGVGYSVPMGLLIAGVAVSAGFMKLLPKWLVWFGLVLALFGEASCLSLIFPKLIMLIPLTRFPGFIWLILVGFVLPKSKEANAAMAGG
jgi:hypothetical protein